LFEVYITSDMAAIQKEYTDFCYKITYHVHFQK
jgi:hypothetical protein